MSKIAYVLAGFTLSSPGIRTARAQATDTETAPPSVEAETQAPVAVPPEPSTRVYLDTQSPVSLYRMDDHGDVKTVCVAPCGENLPLSGLYWVAGRDVNASDKFQLPPNRQETKLFVSGGSKGKVTAGMLLAIAGGNVIFWVGLPILFVAALVSNTSTASGKSAEAPLWASAAAVNGFGLAVGIVGLALWLSNTSPNVETTAKHWTIPRYGGGAWMGGL